MSLDDYEQNWLTLAATVISPVERSVGKILELSGLAIPYEYENASTAAKRETDIEILRRHKDGQPMREIMDALGVGRQRVYNALHAAGIYLRKPKQ